MARRKGRPIDGWLVVDKPSGPSSAQVVARVKRLFDARKAGHAGTLDPLASGLLPVAFGEATKTVAYVMDRSKAYRFTVRWGEARDTDDAEGAVVETSDVRPGEEAIRAALAGFVGVVEQTPPAYSAIKVDGERAYALARAGEEVALRPREVEIEALELVSIPDPDHAVFLMRCGKGAYVRSLARDLARDLGTVGHVAQIRRIEVGPFAEADSISLDKLEALGHSPPPLQHLLPVETALDDIPALAVTELQAGYLTAGRPVRVRGEDGRVFVPGGEDRIDLDALGQGGIVCAISGGRAVALARLAGDEIQPVRVLHAGMTPGPGD